ncbi:phage recombination protein Bet [Gilliamella sp. Choc4-2]|uniref:phage recombination protein Bet n=1 Tax=Gilliamella sp. Choc4-2 TaxID=3120237 RepID=UPI00080DBC10|nr:phage recombination protein Bet [Gilliamella apicola]
MSGNKLNELTLTLAKKLELGSPEGLLDVLKNTAFKNNANDDQLTALLIVANQYSLNPWTKEIYAFPDSKNGIVPIVGVDGWSRILNSHPQYDGIEFCQDEQSCTCKIYRKDRNHPTVITEHLGECKRKGFGPWESHPRRMLRHKAMIQCARLAFGFAGIYDQDEAERIIEGAATEVNIGKQSDDRRPELIKQCEHEAKNGLEAFGSFWMSLSQEDRKIIGNDEKERIKATCPIDAEYQEVKQDDSNPF